MKTINVMIKPASSSCNLRCRYCFYIDETKNRSFVTHGIMSSENRAVLLRRINEALNGKGVANVAFQGGEPTLAGLEWFRAFTEEMKQYPGITVHYHLQTNGTLVTEEWADFFKENNFLIGISLDGFQANMDTFRVDTENQGVFYRVLHCVDLLEKKGVQYNILTVVTRQLARHADALYKFYKTHKMKYIQLIPCMPPMEEEDTISLTPQAYASFYRSFFDSWYKDARKGFFMSVNLFENLAGMMFGQPPYQCGMLGRCSVQFVIEANGDVYPCDFFCLDEHLLGNLGSTSFEEMAASARAQEFLKSSGCRKAPCETCRYVRICNGGCRRQNVCYLTDSYCGYQEVLEAILPRLEAIAARYNR